MSAYAIYALDYRRVYASQNNINEGARQIGGLLLANGLFERHNHVWFVTHSLGGLLVKRMLLIYNSERRERLLSRVGGVFFLAVPSGGSALADVAQDDLARVLLTVIGRNYRSITDLQPDKASAFLGSLEEDWSDFLRGRAANHDAPPYAHCAYEVDKAYKLAKVVEKLFSQMCRDENPMPMSGTHMSIVKPRSIDSPQPYGWVRTALAADAQRLRRWPWVNKMPGPVTLGELLSGYQADHKEDPDTSGLLRVPEEISFRDPASKEASARLLLAQHLYLGSTVAEMLQDIVRQNVCVSMAASEDKRKLSIGVDAATRICKTGNTTRLVCADVACPK
jgi:hypothetical protein